MKTNNEFTKGVLYAKRSDENYTLQRIAPSSGLSRLIETFWSVEWDLSDEEPHTQQNIPDPNVHMVFEPGCSRIVGVVTKRFTHKLADRGSIFGIKFCAGAFYSVYKFPLSGLSDTDISIRSFFGNDGDALAGKIISEVNLESKVSIAEHFLAPFIPDSSDIVDRIDEVIFATKTDESITKVDHLAEKFSLSARSLQRLFYQYVGVSPKWLIRKYRMQEVLTMLESGERNWQDLVSKLDYFDQAHFIRDFKDMIGVTPTDYIKNLELNVR